MDASFSLADWISQAKMPEGEVTVYGDAAAAGEVESLTRQIDQTGDTRLAERLMKRREAAVQRVKDSALTIKLRALTDSQMDDLSDVAPLRDGASTAERVAYDNANACRMLSAMSVDPAVSADQWEAIRNVINPATFAGVVREAGRVNALVVADAPFLRENLMMSQD